MQSSRDLNLPVQTVEYSFMYKEYEFQNHFCGQFNSVALQKACVGYISVKNWCCGPTKYLQCRQKVIEAEDLLNGCSNIAKDGLYELKFHGSCFLVASSQHACDILADTPDTRDILARMSGDFPIQLSMRLPSVCCGVQCCPFVRCRVVLQIPRARHARLVADKSLASSQHLRHTRPISS